MGRAIGDIDRNVRSIFTWLRIVLKYGVKVYSRIPHIRVYPVEAIIALGALEVIRILGPDAWALYVDPDGTPIAFAFLVGLRVAAMIDLLISYIRVA